MTAHGNRRLRAGRWLGAGALALALPFGALSLFFAWLPFPARDVPAGAGAIGGFFHVHTVDSHDGHGTLDEAARAARSLGARFLVLTEHNRLLLERPLVVEGVLVVPGVEISAKAGHVIALGLEALPKERGPKVLEAIAEAGGVAVLAHPVNRRRPWSDPSPEGFAGFEALSLDSAFRDAQAGAWGRLGLALAALVGDRRHVGALLMQRPEEALARYDELNELRRVALMCGVDAHGLPPYLSSFGALMLHLPLDEAALAAWGADPAVDAAQVLAAVREGRTFCSVPALGDASAFTFGPVGGELLARIPTAEARIRLFRNGALAAEATGTSLRHPLGPGRWRVEVSLPLSFPHRKDALWIATSTLHVD